MWHAGDRRDVISYCGQDAKATLELARFTEQLGRLRWISRAGNYQRLPIPQGWRPVGEVLSLPEPDTSWMDNPISRRELTAWLDD